MIKKLTTIVLAISMTACVSNGGSRYDEETVRSRPDSYFKENLTWLSTVEYDEYMRRKRAKSAELDRQAACVFGSRPAIDRKKLNCENVQGSPEYKATRGG